MESRVGQAGFEKGEISLSRGCQVTFWNPSTDLPRQLLADGKLALAVLRPKESTCEVPLQPGWHQRDEPGQPRSQGTLGEVSALRVI